MQRSRHRGKSDASAAYVCLRTYRRRIRAHAAAMKRTATHGRKVLEQPISRRESEYPALRANAADTCDDRVSEDIFDVEDERAEVDIIVHGMQHDVN